MNSFKWIIRRLLGQTHLIKHENRDNFIWLFAISFFEAFLR